MNSQERKEKRYNNRQKKRKKEINTSTKDVFTHNALFYANEAYSHKKNKAAKKYQENSSITIFNIYKQIQTTGLYKHKGLYDIHINDRGKPRDFEAPFYEERFVQKCFVDEYLKPVLSNKILSCNIGNVENKGTEDAISQVIKDLQTMYRHYGTDAWILIMDYQGYFDHMDPKIASTFLDDYEKNILIREQYRQFVQCKDVGLPFGSPVAQFISIIYPSPIDHAAKEKYGIKQYIRYADDSYAMHHSYEYLCEVRDGLRAVANSIGLDFNMEKLKIVPITDFCFLKSHFTMNENGSIKIEVVKKKMKNFKKKFKKLHKQLLEGKKSLSDIAEVYKSTIDHIRIAGSKENKKELINYIETLYGGNIDVLFNERCRRKNHRCL